MSKSLRRGLATALTILALLFVGLGSIFFRKLIEGSPVLFLLFWTGCLLCVVVVVVLAILDMRAIRKEFRKKQRDLDSQFADIIADAKENKLSDD